MRSRENPSLNDLYSFLLFIQRIKDYIEGLSSLQDDVPAFDGRLAVAVVESQLKAPIGELFDSFDEEPLAAASLGQVHRAVLNGEEVSLF